MLLYISCSSLNIIQYFCVMCVWCYCCCRVINLTICLITPNKQPMNHFNVTVVLLQTIEQQQEQPYHRHHHHHHNVINVVVVLTTCLLLNTTFHTCCYCLCWQSDELLLHIFRFIFHVSFSNLREHTYLLLVFVQHSKRTLFCSFF